MKLGLKDFYKGNSLISAYLNGAVSDLHADSFSKENLLNKSGNRDLSEESRTILVDHLIHQYKGVETSELTAENIESLRSKKTFTVTTGHQCNIFGGPLFFLYKILQVINITEELNQSQNDKRFVPVFWMATEDHDFDEISFINLFHQKFSWQTNAGDAVGRMGLSGLSAVLDEIKSKFREDQGEELFELFEKYCKQESLAKATVFLVNELFGKYGLVILDADASSMKERFSEHMENELLHSKSYLDVQETIGELEKANYKVQVNPREINLFYLNNGQRGRIILEGGTYKVVNSNIQFDQKSIIEEVKNYPERFSPNVVMRPMYQEFILPNIAYLGGAGEIAYWLELKKAFDSKEISFPILIVRNSALLMDQSVNKKLKKVELAPDEFLKSEDQLIKEYLKKHSDEIDFESEEEALLKIEENLKQKASNINAGLVSSVEATFAKFSKEIQKMESKFTKTLKQQSELEVSAIRTVKSKFYPEGVLQERYENFTPYFLNFGSQFIDLIKNKIGSFDQKLQFIDLSDANNS